MDEPTLFLSSTTLVTYLPFIEQAIFLWRWRKRTKLTNKTRTGNRWETQNFQIQFLQDYDYNFHYMYILHKGEKTWLVVL